MVFSSLSFIFVFLPAALVFYYIFGALRLRKLSNAALLALSLIFYACSTPKYIVLLLISIFINHISGLLCGAQKTHKKLFLFIGIALDLGLLFYFKYANFFFDNLSLIFGIGSGIAQIALPIGISFFTFQGISYVADVYRGVVKPQKNILNTALYISLFPQLIAGPIVRYSDIETGISDRQESLSLVFDGIIRFCTGLGKKVIIADCAGLVADRIFGLDKSLLSVSLAWLGVGAYTLQIYFDFSGYSDMAIGLGKLFGFHFPENFNYPYISKSISEFWRRWHMTLSAWFRDYVYIPLGGNRCSVKRHIFNMAVVWLLTGLWHGASWSFVVWGGYFALILICEKYVYGGLLEKLPSVIRHIYALILIMVGWSIFCGDSLRFTSELLKTMFFMADKPLINSETLYYITEYKAELILGVVCCLPLTEILERKFMKGRRANTLITLGKAVFGLSVFALSVCFILSSSFSPFIYFRF